MGMWEKTLWGGWTEIHWEEVRDDLMERMEVTLWRLWRSASWGG